MSLAPLIEFHVTTQSQSSAQLEFIVNAASASGATALVFALTTSDPIGAAMKPAAQSRVIGARLSIDSAGDGSLVPVKGFERGDTIRISGTLGDFGARELTFSRYGKDFSPFISSALREQRGVSMSIVRGVRGNRATKKMFDGSFGSSTFQPYPPLAAITCKDASMKFASTPFFYTLAPGSGQTRLAVLLDIFTKYGMPYSNLVLPDSDGGKVFKPINEGGSRSVLDFINDFIAPMGCRQNWKGNLINIRRPGTRVVRASGGFGTGGLGTYIVPDVPVRTLRPCDIRSISIQPPNTDAPNAIRFTALVFGYLGPTGQRTEVKIVKSNGVYAPQVATNKQDHTTGVVSATGLASASATREVSRIVTTTNYAGGTVVSQTISEFGYYAPRACDKRQTAPLVLSSLTSVGATATATTAAPHGLITGDSVTISGATPSSYNGSYSITVTGASTFTYTFATGASPATGTISWYAISFNDQFDVYKFPDGSWRTTAQEDFQEINRTVLTRTFDTNGYLTDESIDYYRIAPQETYVSTYVLVGSAFVETIVACLTTSDGRAWTNGKEMLYAEHTARNYQFDSSTFQLMRTVETVTSPSVAQYLLFFPPSTGVSSGPAVRFGPSSAPRYGFAVAGTQSLFSVVKTYATVSESSYRVTVSVNSSGEWLPGSFQSKPSSSTSVVQGSVPLDEQLTSQQKAQPTSILLNDKVRQVFNNGRDVLVMYQNDFCETEGELITCAMELMREIASPRVSIEMDFDAMCEEGVTVAVNYPGLTLKDEKMLVWDWEATLNMNNAQNSQTLTCRWDPPELRASA
jgi:hypothetical protein